MDELKKLVEALRAVGAKYRQDHPKPSFFHTNQIAAYQLEILRLETLSSLIQDLVVISRSLSKKSGTLEKAIKQTLITNKVGDYSFEPYAKLPLSEGIWGFHEYVDKNYKHWRLANER